MFLSNKNYKEDFFGMKRIGLLTLILTVGLLLTGLPAQADTVIGTYDQNYGSVDIGTKVTDLTSGPLSGQYLWQYNVNNISFNTPGGNGFSGFEIYLPDWVPDIENETPDSPWIIDGFSGEPVEWDLPTGDGVMPGQSLTFSFTTNPRAVAIYDDGWFHSWNQDPNSNWQIDIVDTPGMHVPWMPGLTAIPEPPTLLLTGAGLLALGLIAFRKKIVNI